MGQEENEKKAETWIIKGLKSVNKALYLEVYLIVEEERVGLCETQAGFLH